MTDETSKDSNAPEREERIRKIYVKDLREKDRIHTVFLVGKKAKITARSGKSFLSVTLQDRTGEVDARVFDKVDDLDKVFGQGDYILMQGGVILFQGRPQVVIDSAERLDPEPIDPKEFTPSQGAAASGGERPAKPAAEARPPREDRVGEGGTGADKGHGPAVVRQIREIVERVEDPNVKALLFAFLDDEEIRAKLPIAPAAKGVHHAYRGGLADHLLSVMRLAHRVADHYPVADRDLLVAGAFLHDICKVQEISAEKGFHYTDEGKLVGHLVMTAQLIREKSSRIPGFPKHLEQHLTHIVIAHHGQLEFGSPKLPVTLEAQLVHFIDLMDSRVASFVELMARDPGDRWTDAQNLYNRHLYKGPSATKAAKSPVERKARRPREEREGGRERDRDRKRPEGRREEPKVEHRERPERAESRERPEGRERPERSSEKPAEKSEPQPMPTFKPLDQLVKDEPPKAE